MRSLILRDVLRTFILAILCVLTLQNQGRASEIKNIDPVDPISPLVAEERRLIASPSEIKVKVVIAQNPALQDIAGTMLRLPVDELNKETRVAYYDLALRRALLLADDDKLVIILNKLVDDKVDVKRTVLEFESKFFEIHKKYPDIVPVDSVSILSRMLNQSKLQ